MPKNNDVTVVLSREQVVTFLQIYAHHPNGILGDIARVFEKALPKSQYKVVEQSSAHGGPGAVWVHFTDGDAREWLITTFYWGKPGSPSRHEVTLMAQKLCAELNEAHDV